MTQTYEEKREKRKARRQARKKTQAPKPKSTWRVKKFQGGMKGAVYTCRDCGKRTRETGYSESSVGLCAKCFEEGGLINEHSDNDGHFGFNGEDLGYNPNCPTCRAERAKGKK